MFHFLPFWFSPRVMDSLHEVYDQGWRGRPDIPDMVYGGNGTYFWANHKTTGEDGMMHYYRARAERWMTWEVDRDMGFTWPASRVLGERAKRVW